VTRVVLRRVEHRLAAMVKPRRGGVRVAEALAAAAENLKGIEAECRRDLEDSLAPIMAFLARNPDERPADEEIVALLSHVNRALTACGALDLPLLGRTLIMLGAMADALAATRHWPAGALNPAINLVWLFSQRTVPSKEAEALIAQLQLCLDQYRDYAPSRPNP